MNSVVSFMSLLSVLLEHFCTQTVLNCNNTAGGMQLGNMDCKNELMSPTNFSYAGPTKRGVTPENKQIKTK